MVHIEVHVAIFFCHHLLLLTYVRDYFRDPFLITYIIALLMMYSGAKNFTTDTLSNFISKVESDHNSFFAIEILKRGGFIGNQVPENFMCEALHDREEDMMKCLFPQQDKQCWDPEYWVK